jgi:hypothetical protein
MHSSARLPSGSREAIRREPGCADRRRGPSAGSRWRCRAGPWECRRRGFSSGAPEIGHRVGNGGRRWRRRSPTCPPTLAGRTGRRDRRGPARHELAGIEESTVATLMAEARRVWWLAENAGGAVRPHRTSPPARRPTGCAAISPRTQWRDVPRCGDLTETPTDVGKLHSRRCWICIRGAHTDTRHWMVPCVQPTLSVDPPPVIRRQSQNPVVNVVVPTADEVWFGAHYGFGRRGARRVGVSVSRGVLRNTRRNLPI